MRGKIFSREEANRMVPLIRRIVVNIRARQRLLQRRRDDAASARAEGSAREEVLRAHRRLKEQIKGYTDELEGLGCFLRDAESGIVECYGELHGEIVYFTWQPGYKAFLCWHPLDQSYVKRQPLPGVRLPAAREAAE